MGKKEDGIIEFSTPRSWQEQLRGTPFETSLQAIQETVASTPNGFPQIGRVVGAARNEMGEEAFAQFIGTAWGLLVACQQDQDTLLLKLEDRFQSTDAQALQIVRGLQAMVVGPYIHDDEFMDQVVDELLSPTNNMPHTWERDMPPEKESRWLRRISFQGVYHAGSGFIKQMVADIFPKQIISKLTGEELMTALISMEGRKLVDTVYENRGDKRRRNLLIAKAAWMLVAEMISLQKDIRTLSGAFSGEFISPLQQKGIVDYYVISSLSAPGEELASGLEQIQREKEWQAYEDSLDFPTKHNAS